MPSLDLILDGDGCWPDLAKEKVFQSTQTLSVAALPNGTVNGSPTITIRGEMPDGTVALFETSLALLLMVSDALRLHFGDPRK